MKTTNTTPQQQPEEKEKLERPHGDWCISCGFGLHRKKTTTPKQTEKCKNYLPVCVNCGRSQSAHPQQTEQWIDLVRKQVQLIRENAVGVEAGRYVDFGEALEQGMVSLVSDITKSQIEAAEKRGQIRGGERNGN